MSTKYNIASVTPDWLMRYWAAGHYGANVALKGADGSTTVKWNIACPAANLPTYWYADFGFDNAYVIDLLKLYNSATAAAIKNVTVYGGNPDGNGGLTWTEIITGDFSSSAGWGELALTGNTTAYRAYTIKINSTRGTSSYPEIIELEFYGPDGQSPSAALTKLNNSGHTYSAGTTQAGSSPDNLGDGDWTTAWYAANSVASNWIKCDFGDGNAKKVTRFTLYHQKFDDAYDLSRIKNYIIEASHDDVNWTQLASGETPDQTTSLLEYSFTNTAAYRCYRMTFTDMWSTSGYHYIYEWGLWGIDVQDIILTDEGIPSAEAFGSHGAQQIARPASIASAEALGTAQLNLTLKPTSITSAEGFGSATLAILTVVHPSAIDSAGQVGSHQVNPGPVTISLDAGGVPSQEAVSEPLVAPDQFIEEFTWLKANTNLRGYIVTTETGGIPAGYTPVWTYYHGSWRWIFFPDTGMNWIGRPAVMPGLLRLTVPESILSPDPYDTGLDFGTPELICGPVDVASAGVTSAEAFGTAQLNQFLLPESGASVEAFGTPSVVPIIRPVAIESGETLPSDTELIPGKVDVFPTGIPSGEDVGEPLFGFGVRSIGIESGEICGVPNVVQIVQSGSIAPECSVGIPGVLYLIKPNGIASAAAIGSTNVIQLVRPSAIASEQTLEGARLIPGPVFVYPAGIESGVSEPSVLLVRRPKEPSGLVVLEISLLPVLEVAVGQAEICLYDSPIRMVVNG